MFVFKIAKIALPPTRTLKFALIPMPTSNTSQWNIGGVGSSGIGTHVGHVHFMLFGSISFVLGTQRERVYSGIWAVLSGTIFNHHHDS